MTHKNRSPSRPRLPSLRPGPLSSTLNTMLPVALWRETFICAELEVVFGEQDAHF